MHKVMALVVLAACSSDKQPEGGPVGKTEAASTTTSSTKKKPEPAIVDCAALLSIDDVAKNCTASVADLEYQHHGTGKRGTACTVTIRSKNPAQYNLVRVSIESDPNGTAKTKLSLSRAVKNARIVDVGEEGVAQTETIPAVRGGKEVSQSNESVRARKGPYWVEVMHSVREGEPPKVVCTPEGVLALAKLVVSHLPD